MKHTLILGAVFVGLIMLLNSIDIIDKQTNSSQENKQAGTIDLGMKQLPAAITEKKLVVKDIMKPSSEQIESDEDVEVGESIGDDIFLPPLVEASSSDSSTKTEKIKLNVKDDKPSKELSYREKLALQEAEFYRKMYLNQKNSDMNINIKRNVELTKSDKVILKNDLLPEQPKVSQDEVIDDSLTYLVIIDEEPKTLSGKEYRAYLNTQNSNQQVKQQATEDYSLDSGVDDFLSNIKPEPIKPKTKKASDDDIPDLNALMD
jgi:hypothetical protein